MLLLLVHLCVPVQAFLLTRTDTLTTPIPDQNPQTYYSPCLVEVMACIAECVHSEIVDRKMKIVEHVWESHIGYKEKSFVCFVCRKGFRKEDTFNLHKATGAHTTNVNRQKIELPYAKNNRPRVLSIGAKGTDVRVLSKAEAKMIAIDEPSTTTSPSAPSTFSPTTEDHGKKPESQMDSSKASTPETPPPTVASSENSSASSSSSESDSSTPLSQQRPRRRKTKTPKSREFVSSSDSEEESTCWKRARIEDPVFLPQDSPCKMVQEEPVQEDPIKEATPEEVTP